MNGARAAGVKISPQRFRRGVYLLPSMFTVANLFCGYACVVYATRGDFDTAALFIGIAMVLDTLDGFVARLTKTSSALRRRSSTRWPTSCRSASRRRSWRSRGACGRSKRLGWAAGFIYVTAAAMRLARFNIQTATATDKRYFVGMPSPAAAGVIASTDLPVSGGPAGPRSGAAGAGDGASCRRC